MTFDESSIDHVLSTTRAVRLRLDLEREVEKQIIVDCIGLAEQAPTGGNLGSRRWIVVTDPTIKKQLAELYYAAGGSWMVRMRDDLQGTGHPNEQMMKSAAFLAENLESVPMIVIPTIIGKHDGSGRPGLFDSVIQSAWSFCLALRARGLGTAWTTAVFEKRDELKSLLGIPPEITEIVMLPVAWTKGTDFSPARRHDARDITFFDKYSKTFESGPSSPISFNDGPGTIVEIDIDASVKKVWSLVVDINFPASFSEEFVGAKWEDDNLEPSIGALFIGRNNNEHFGDWSVNCFVDSYEKFKTFGWCTGNFKHPGARWRFELEAFGGGTRVRFRVVLGPGPSGLTRLIEANPENESDIIDSRLDALKHNMVNVLEGIKTALD